MEHLVKLLKENNNIDEFLVTEVKTESKELFFIKDELQMNRGKDVHYFYVDVFKNFEENGKRYKGSSSCKLAPNMTSEEMNFKLENAVLAASNVRNEYYDLVSPTDEIPKKIESSFLDTDIIENISKLVKDLFQEDNQFDAFINSVEFFINKSTRRIVNSNGIDVSFDSVAGEIELVTEANGEKESIELFEILNFSDYDQENIKETIKEELYYASLRAKAIPMPSVENLPIIMKGTAAEGLFEYYLFQTSASAVYQKFHEHKVGDDLFPIANGDKVTITQKPYIKNSTRSRYIDGDGMMLKDTVIIEDGVIKNLVASKRFADYLNITPTGSIGNIVVNGGKYTEKELKQEPYLELIKFSSFQADAFTGNFGGEFRLGIYFDGEKEIPVTLGSVSGKLGDCQKDMYLSKEQSQSNNKIVPKVIKFMNMSLAAN